MRGWWRRSSTDSFTYPSVNVIAKVPGRDPRLRDEYVLFSAHQDHDGERYPVNGDNIWNGADDNATTSVALLAIGRAMAAQPARRSALFIWHGAEERGLMGSRWYVKHPDGAAEVDRRRPQRRHDRPQRSDDGGAARRAASASQLAGTRGDGARPRTRRCRSSSIDSSWDDPQHREGWYYRSDHLPYARAGIPALFFTTLLHADYHTPFDNPDRIDIAKLTKMTRWMYATGPRRRGGRQGARGRSGVQAGALPRLHRKLLRGDSSAPTSRSTPWSRGRFRHSRS